MGQSTREHRPPRVVKCSRYDLLHEVRAAESKRLDRPVSQREVVDSALLWSRGRGLHPETERGDRTPLRYRR